MAVTAVGGGGGGGSFFLTVGSFLVLHAVRV